MTTIVGADGCRAGWLCIFEELPSRQLGSKIFATVAELFAAAREIDVLAIDIPIGLTDAGPRQCDVAARAVLGPKRATSVFPAPIRPALGAGTYEEACEISFRTHRKKLSRQSWAIYPKIRELDLLLRNDEAIARRVYEVHPEVTFAAWNGAPIAESKKSDEGFARRLELVTTHFGEQAFENVRRRYPRKRAANDDILDAFAALWTAERIVEGRSRSLPPQRMTDAAELPMRIVY